MKDNFLLKKSQQQVIEDLSNEDAGKLFKGIYEYVNTGNSKLDGYLKTIFISFKIEIDRNEENYQKTIEKNRKNGMLGGRPRNPENPLGFEETECNPKKPTCHNHIHNQKENNNLNIIKEVINYLNTKTNSNYKYSSKLNQSKVNARLNEGYSLDDFIVVIDKKYDEWAGTEFERYLCPETLFGTKFEKYLNQTDIKKKKRDYKPMDEETVEFIENYDWLDSNGD